MVEKWKQKVASTSATLLEFLGGPKIGGGLKVGVEAPGLRIENWTNLSETQERDLKSLKGKDVFVELWSSQCPPCVESVPKIKRVFAGYKDKVQFRTVHVDLHDPPPTDQEIRDFVVNQSIQYPVGIDRSGDLWDRFAFSHLPHGLLIDECGRVKWSGSLFTNDIEAVFRRYYGAAAAHRRDDDKLESEGNYECEPVASVACKGGVCRREPTKIAGEDRLETEKHDENKAVGSNECEGGVCRREPKRK